MKALEIQTAGGMYLVGEHLRFGPSSAGLKELGITGPGILKVEFVPDPDWPEEPNEKAWTESYGVNGSLSMDSVLHKPDYKPIRRRCGLAAAGWWFEIMLSGCSDEEYDHANKVARQWLKWSEGKEWR